MCVHFIQWRYISANSCSPPGYDAYFAGANSQGVALPDSFWSPQVSECQTPYPQDGSRSNVWPEQFFNCAEGEWYGTPWCTRCLSSPRHYQDILLFISKVEIVNSGSGPTPTPPAPTPPSTVGGSCGSGNLGNGICADTSLCCSEYGW